QEKTIERVGSCKSIMINTRVIAATNINLRQAVAERRFREDLYYRLNVLTLALPPLRERGEDVQLLAKFFLRRFADELGRPDLVLSSAAEAYIASYAWPGNVRELIACIRRAAVMADRSAIEVLDLGLIQTPKAPDGDNQDLLKARAETEVQLVRQTLERNRFNIKRSAKDLHISRMTLYRLIQKHGIAIDRTPGRSLAPASADRCHA
ncbi:MAG: sigma 54-interacting transcriptional regulator, partial [Pseudomonadota bacterium]